VRYIAQGGGGEGVFVHGVQGRWWWVSSLPIVVWKWKAADGELQTLFGSGERRDGVDPLQILAYSSPLGRDGPLTRNEIIAAML